MANPLYSSIGSKVVRKIPGSTVNCWVYVISCSECDLSSLGLTGKDLGVNEKQHRDAVHLAK